MKHFFCLSALLLSGSCLGHVRADAPTPASAEAAFAAGKFDDAHKTYERLVKSDPRAAGPRLGLVRSLLRLDKWRDALREARAATLAAPADADARGLLALAEMRAGRPDAAASDSKQALSLDKDDYWGLIAAGRVAEWDARHEESRAFFARATALHPERPDAWLGLWDDADENHLDEAEIAAARKYLALDPKGQPFDRETPYLKNFVQNQIGFWRKFETSPAFQVVGSRPDASYTATLPIQRAGDYVTVTVGINGQTFHLLFDTGAGGLLLSRKAAKRLALPDLADSQVSGVQGSAPAKLQRAETMTLGALTLHSIPLTVIESAGETGDGILGGDVLDEYAVTLDFDNSTMTLMRGPGAGHMARPHTSVSTLPLHTFGDHLFVSAHAQEEAAGAPDRPFWAMLDTGAETNFFSLVLTHDLSAHTIHDDWHEGSFTERTGIGNSSMKVDYCLTLAKVKLTFDGSDHVSNQIGLNGESVMDQQISPDSDFEIGMLLGIPILNQHSRVTIDYPHHLLTFEDPV